MPLTADACYRDVKGRISPQTTAQETPALLAAESAAAAAAS